MTRARRDYISLEVKFFTDPEVLAIGRDLAFRLAASIAWCHGNKTDGFINTAAGKELVPRKADRTTLEAHWWEPVKGGWRIHNYLEHQPSKAAMDGWSEAGRTAATVRHGARRSRVASEPSAERNANRMQRSDIPKPRPIGLSDVTTGVRGLGHIGSAVDRVLADAQTRTA